MNKEKQIKIGSFVRMDIPDQKTRYGIVIKYFKDPAYRRGKPSKFRTFEFIAKGMMAPGVDWIQVHWSNGEEGFAYPHLVEVVA